MRECELILRASPIVSITLKDGPPAGWLACWLHVSVHVSESAARENEAFTYELGLRPRAEYAISGGEAQH